MSHETPTLAAERRERLGSRYANRLRKSGRLPAVVYGHGADPLSISVDAKDTLKHLHHGIHVFTIAVEGAGEETCLVKDLQFGYLGDDVIHVDFARVDLDELVTLNVSLNFRGVPKGGEKPGHIVVHDLAELEIECAVRNIPEAIRIDLEAFDEIVHVSDLVLPEGVTATTPGETLVLHVQAPKGGESDEEGEEASAEG